MPPWSIPPADEPADFRRQAAGYARFRCDYSDALYAAIAERCGPGAGRRALDLGCGTGFVAARLGARGFVVTGIDFSAPMIVEGARALRGTPVRLVRARAEQLPLRSGSQALVACGTAFHWFDRAAALGEISRVLAPDGCAALFWRYPDPGQPSLALLAGALRAVGVDVPEPFEHPQAHEAEPFAGTGLVAEPPVEIATELTFTAAGFHGVTGTIEWLRRLAADRHAAFLARLEADLSARYPDGFRERQREVLFLARRI